MAYSYAQRNAQARAEGFRGYYQKREYMRQAAEFGAPKGNDRTSVANRLAIARAVKENNDNPKGWSKGDWLNFLRQHGVKTRGIPRQRKSSRWGKIAQWVSPPKRGVRK